MTVINNNIDTRHSFGLLTSINQCCDEYHLIKFC